MNGKGFKDFLTSFVSMYNNEIDRFMQQLQLTPIRAITEEKPRLLEPPFSSSFPASNSSSCSTTRSSLRTAAATHLQNSGLTAGQKETLRLIAGSQDQSTPSLPRPHSPLTAIEQAKQCYWSFVTSQKVTGKNVNDKSTIFI